MAKYHINKHGVPAPCRAKEGNCPLGGDESHFNSKEEAQEYADKQNESEFSFLPRQESRQEVEGYESFKDKEVKVEYDGKSFEGKVIGDYKDSHDSQNDGIIVQDKDGNVKHIKRRRMEGEPVDLSKPKDVMAQRMDLFNEAASADPDGPYIYDGRTFERFSEEIVKVKYDGKSFTGRVIGTHNDMKDPMNDGIIIKDAEGNVKHIKARRLEEEPASYTELSEMFARENDGEHDDSWEDYSEMAQFEFAEEMNNSGSNQSEFTNRHLDDLNPNDYGEGGKAVLEAYKNTKENYPGSDEIIMIDSPSTEKGLDEAVDVMDRGGVNSFTLVDQGYDQKAIVDHWQKYGWRIEGVEQVEVDDTESSIGGMVKDVNSLQMKRIKSDGNKIQTLSPGEKTNLKEFLDEQVTGTKTIDSYEMRPDSVVVNGKEYKTLEDLDDDVFF